MDMEQLLRAAAQEIRELRGENLVLRSQIEIVEAFKAAIGARSSMSAALRVDIAHTLDEAAKSIASAERQREIDAATAAEQADRIQPVTGQE